MWAASCSVKYWLAYFALPDWARGGRLLEAERLRTLLCLGALKGRMLWPRDLSTLSIIMGGRPPPPR